MNSKSKAEVNSLDYCCAAVAKMLSVIFLFLIFLGKVNKVSSPTDKHCEWFCTITSKSTQTADKMEVWFNVSERIDKECVANSMYLNLQNTTTTGYVFISSLLKESDCHDGFSFMEFTTRTDLEHPFWTKPMNKTAVKYVSCFLQPMSNQTEMAVSDGLAVRNSPRFYISFNQSRNKPFVSIVHLETKYHISVGCSNGNVSEDYELSLPYFFHIFSWLIRIGYIIYFPLFLTFFCHTVEKVESNDLCGRGPEEQDERPIPSEHAILEMLMARRNDSSMNLEDESDAFVQRSSGEQPTGPPALEHRSEDIEAAASQRNTNSATESKMYVIDVDGPASPVGIRSFVSNNIFLNKANSSEANWKKICYCFVEFVILMIFLLSPLIWIDVFVFWIPRWFIQSPTNLPSPYLTKLVFTFAYETYPVGIFVCAGGFGLRMLCMCCKPSSKVVSVPNNIQKYLKSFSWKIFTRDWGYCSEILKDDLNWAYKCVTLVIFVFMAITKIFLECIITLPIVSLCYGGHWYLVNWFENKFARALFSILEFVWICISIAWVAYISHCCSLSLLIALKSLLFSGLKYPIETSLSVALYLVTYHSMWKLYSHFTDNYFSLLHELFKICNKHHPEEMKKYKVESRSCIPEDLFDCACNKFEPVKKNFKKLVQDLSVYTIVLFFLTSVLFGTKYPKDDVLKVTVTLLAIFHPSLWDFLWRGDEEKTFKKSRMKRKLKDVVDKYFTGIN